MAETGWPLIPRETLPAPVKPARSARHRPTPEPVASQVPTPDGADPGRQLSIFGAETSEASPADLAGLLAGPGHLVRMGGTARVSVRVDAAWRVHVLVDELVRRGLVVTWRPAGTPQVDDRAANQLPDAAPIPDRTAGSADAPDFGYDDEPASAVIGGAHRETDVSSAPGLDEVGPTVARSGEAIRDEAAVPGSVTDGDCRAGDREAAADPAAGPREGGEVAFEVRTAYSRRLSGLAGSWPAAVDRLFLSGPRLRLWVAAAGRPVAGGYALGLDPGADSTHVDAALVRVGLAGTVSDDGRYYLILGRKRLARLAELVGERPREAPAGVWPSGAVA